MEFYIKKQKFCLPSRGLRFFCRYFRKAGIKEFNDKICLL